MSKPVTSVVWRRARLSLGLALFTVAACSQAALSGAAPSSEGWTRASRAAALSMQRGDLKAAARLYQQALQIAERENIGREHIINLLLNQSEVLVRMSAFQEAHFSLNRAGIMIKEDHLGHRPVAIRFHRRLARLYEAQSRLKEAAEEQKQLINLIDEIFGQNTHKTIQELRHLQALQEWGKLYPDCAATGEKLLQLMNEFHLKRTSKLWSDTAMGIGKAYFEMEQYDLAKKNFLIAYDKCVDRGDADFSRHSAVAMMQLCERVADFPGMAKWAQLTLSWMSKLPQDREEMIDQKTLVVIMLARAQVERKIFEPGTEKELLAVLHRENQCILEKHKLDNYVRKAMIGEWLILFLLHRNDLDGAVKLTFALPAGICTDMGNLWPFIHMHREIAAEYEKRGHYRQAGRQYEEVIKLIESQSQIKEWLDWVAAVRFIRVLSFARQRINSGMPLEKAFAEALSQEGLTLTDSSQLWEMTRHFADAKFTSQAQLALELACKRYERENRPSNRREASAAAGAIDAARQRGIDITVALTIGKRCNAILGTPTSP